MIDFLFGRILKVPAVQRRVVLQLFIYSFMLAGSYQIGRIAADSMFLARLGIAALPTVFLLSGIAVAIAAFLGSILLRYFPVKTVTTLTGLLLSVLTLITASLLPQFHHSPWLLGAIYLIAEVRGAMGAISISWATHDLIPSESRYSFAAIGLSLPIAAITLGILMGVEAYSLPTAYWLVIAAIFDLVSVVPLWVGRGRFGSVESQPVPTDVEKSTNPKSRTPFANGNWVQSLSFAILALGFFKFVTLTIVSFEWKKYTEVYFGSDEHKLTAYFSAYYAITYLLSVLMQTLYAGRLLHRKSFRIVLVLLPLILAVLAVLLVAFPTAFAALVILTLSKGTESWRRSIDDTGSTVLVSRVPKRNRNWLISIQSGIVKPVSEIYAATVVWFLASWSSDLSVWIWLGAALLWATWTLVATQRSRK